MPMPKKMEPWQLELNLLERAFEEVKRHVPNHAPHCICTLCVAAASVGMAICCLEAVAGGLKSDWIEEEDEAPPAPEPKPAKGKSGEGPYRERA
jgi:hypothetical protein